MTGISNVTGLVWFVSVCGGSLSRSGDSSEKISSPLYPYRYPTNSVCLWDIQVDWPRLVEVRFEDMSILPGATAGQCGDNYVTVSDIL